MIRVLLALGALEVLASPRAPRLPAVLEVLASPRAPRLPAVVRAASRRRALRVAGGYAAITPVSFKASGDRAFAHAMNITTSPFFDKVHEDQGICVFRHAVDRDCLKATATIDAPLAAVVAILKNASRSKEYNEHCHELKEVERFGDGSQITWTSTASMGPFKARDFLTAVHVREMDGDVVALVNHAVDDHENAPPRDDERYVRSTVRVGCTICRPCPSDPAKTEIELLSAIEDTAISQSPTGAAIARKVAETGPVTFIKALEAVARRDVGAADAVADDARRTSPAKSTTKSLLASWLGFDDVAQSARAPAPSARVRVWSGPAPW